MVVTDLHGDWKTYQFYRDQFVNLYSERKLNWLIFTGDLIHSETKGFDDQSIEIVLDILNLKSKFGDAIIPLCGNHELPHIYGYGLAKGNIEYTPSFELQMSKNKLAT
jgi:predicted phosphodiesterase